MSEIDPPKLGGEVWRGLDDGLTVAVQLFSWDGKRHGAIAVKYWANDYWWAANDVMSARALEAFALHERARAERAEAIAAAERELRMAASDFADVGGLMRHEQAVIALRDLGVDP